MPCKDTQKILNGLNQNENKRITDSINKLYQKGNLTKTLRFFINKDLKELDSIDPRTTILEYLRENGFTGTKLGCAEGGCGACSVVIAEYDYEKSIVKYRSANSCIMPLCSAHNKQIITIEGIGNTSMPHPVQVIILQF
jgi:xanthine dehydrogenase iron-sulfur cluster and FAD-binding subunit A